MKTKVIFAAFVCVFLAPVLVCLHGLYSFFLEPALENARMRLRFVSAPWKSQSRNSGELWPMRLRMADDLIRSRQLNGKTKQEVVKILGPPDDAGGFNSPEMHYHLGPERGVFRTDSECLEIRLDKQNMVKQVTILTD